MSATADGKDGPAAGRGVDLEAFVVRKAAGDRVVLDDRTSLLGVVLGARALLECVER